VVLRCGPWRHESIGHAGKEPKVKKIVQFFKDSIGELKKVVWPSRDDVIASTKVVIISTLIVALFLGAVDWLLYQGIRLLFGIG
jgi:preprotein translocase subunit SecE